MRTFHFFTTDERNNAPTLAVVTVNNTDRALELARRTLSASPHHLCVEIHEGDAMLVRLDRNGGDLET